MPDAAPWLPDLWREACLHLEIGDFTARAATLLAGRLPVAALVVRRLGPDVAGIVETAAAVGGDVPATNARMELDRESSRACRAWIDSGELQIMPAGSAAALRPPLPDGIAVAVPLRGVRDARGALFVVLDGGDPGDPDLRHALLALRRPFAAALENDARLRELVELRQSAEADRSSLLNRLGRDRLLEKIVGAEGGLGGVMKRVAMVAASDVPVLLLGETGSGKEVIARAIHERSARAHGPFTRVNCGAIPGELVDSELFGHEKGSFTGATARRRGWFERSDGGTLLLDEIGELPRAAQVRLLRVLQDGTIQRVGGESYVRVDVRVVAATHSDLAGMVQRGEFREDQWYRLAVFPLLIPPLRDRVEDIPTMVETLARRAARRFGLRPQAATAADLALLTAYPWPGNVRELGSVVDRAARRGLPRPAQVNHVRVPVLLSGVLGGLGSLLDEDQRAHGRAVGHEAGRGDELRQRGVVGEGHGGRAVGHGCTCLCCVDGSV